MKKKDFKRLAFLGMATGALVAQSGVEAAENNCSCINLDHVVAKPSCKAHGGCAGLTADRACRAHRGCAGLTADRGCHGPGGCGGLTADRDPRKPIYQDDDANDPNIPEDTYEDDNKVK